MPYAATLNPHNAKKYQTSSIVHANVQKHVSLEKMRRKEMRKLGIPLFCREHKATYTTVCPACQAQEDHLAKINAYKASHTVEMDRSNVVDTLPPDASAFGPVKRWKSIPAGGPYWTDAKVSHSHEDNQA